MKRLVAGALALGLLSAACSGSRGSALMPKSVAVAGVPSQFGARTTMSLASTAELPVGWAVTGTQAVPLTSASDAGALPATTKLDVSVALQLRNVAQLQQAVASGQIVPRATFANEYAPTQAQVDAVASYLRAQGFTNVAASSNNLLVSASATAAQATAAFDTQLESYVQDGVAVFANTKPAYVPQSLAGTVVAVLGLNTAAKAHAKHPENHPDAAPAPAATPTPVASPAPTSAPVTNCVKGVTSPACVRFYDPSTFGVTYHVGTTPTGSGTSVAVMAEGDVASSISDLRVNEAKFNLPQVPVTIVPVGLHSGDTAGAGEWTLDMTYASGMAGTLKSIYLYDTTSLNDADIAREYNAWVTDDLAPIGNSSFGGCEFGPYLDGSMLVDDEILLQGASQGQTMFVSTGDSGGFCGVGAPNGVPAGAPLVEYPAASPYVVAVGGTDLFSNADGTYAGETAWEAGGGGNSQFEYSPYWESGIQPVGSTPAGLSLRGLPDVAMDAAIETGAYLYTTGAAVNGSCTPCTDGGTSLASPLAAGAFARMQTAHGNALGFAPPLLYRIYAQSPGATTVTGPPPTQSIGGFHDIIGGSNGTYAALPRYDYTTGLGSFDIQATNSIIGH